jgi:predicted dehydrogenase
MKKNLLFLLTVLFVFFYTSIKPQNIPMSKNSIRIITLDPGHFHAALVQKSMYNQIDSTVYVYAPDGDDLQNHLNLVNSYNTRPENPTHWNEVVYTGPDYFEKMLKDKPGNVVVISGNNEKKTEYIKASVDAGLNVLADKPMAINSSDFELLKQSFESAKKHGVLLYDIMTERSEITNILQKEFSLLPEVFGTLEKGTLENPAIVNEGVHNFYKYVSGSVLKRPPWFFDVTQQGEGLVDITTHLVDLVQWECFPEQSLDYKKDIQVLTAKRWSTKFTPAQFNTITRLQDYPDYLKKYVKDSILSDYCNGEINYKIKGVYTKITSIWNYEAPEGSGDSYNSIMRGTKASLIIRQGPEQKYQPTLYIEPAAGIDLQSFEKVLESGLKKIIGMYEGVLIKKLSSSWEVVIPDKYKVGHEAHFAQVMERFLKYLADRKLPDWEVPNMLAKYYTTTKALDLTKQN